MVERIPKDEAGFPGKKLLVVEVISEGPHCVPCQYAIAAVKHISEFYQGRVEFKVVETEKPKDVARYFDLCRINGAPIPVPAIVIAGKLAFDQIPGPEELRRRLDIALQEWESYA